jgi:hypothetical protein
LFLQLSAMSKNYLPSDLHKGNVRAKYAKMPFSTKSMVSEITMTRASIKIVRSLRLVFIRMSEIGHTKMNDFDSVSMNRTNMV